MRVVTDGSWPEGTSRGTAAERIAKQARTVTRIAKGTALARNRGRGNLRLTREGGGRIVLRRNWIRIENSD